MDSDDQGPPRDSSGLADDPLPPVQPPSAGFLLQLFVIPLVIVTSVALVVLMLNWLAHLGTSPRRLVNDLHRLHDGSWQKALTLAELLRNPRHDALRDDADLAGELAEILENQLEAGSTEPQPIQLRMFLCRALGEFRDPSVLPPLLKAARQEKDDKDIDVRRAALEAIAVHASHTRSTALKSDERVFDVLREASRERSDRQEDRAARAELRSTAAYALGVLGGKEALDRLELLVADAHSNTRYNAGLGLARYGDRRAIPIVLEMLNPDNTELGGANESETGQAAKRLLVITNGIRGAVELAENNSRDDLSRITAALEAARQSKLERFNPRARNGIRIRAQEALITMKNRAVEAEGVSSQR